jgi:hypothetical protein
MGTRADFYVGRGEKAEWLGSIAWDGYPDGIAQKLLRSKSEEDYRFNLKEFFKERDDATLPEDGWPWPWEDSNTTDYAYAFDGGKVWASGFGRKWFNPLKKEPKVKDNDSGRHQVFPNMKSIQKVTLGKRSGVIVMGIQ